MVAHKGAVHIIGLLAVLVLLCYSGTPNVFDISYQNDNTLSDDFLYIYIYIYIYVYHSAKFDVFLILVPRLP